MTSSTIVYVSWPATEKTGGIKMAFKHVETLRAHGYDSFVATPDGLPPGWFDTSVPVRTFDALLPDAGGDAPRQVLVFPENNRDFFERFAAWPNHKVLFCQSQYMIVRGFGGRAAGDVAGMQAVICPGEVPAQVCRRRFPGLPVHVVHNYIDPRVFSPQAVKHLQIACMPVKRPMEAAAVQDLFRAENPQWAQVPWVALQGLPEAEVARVLRESAVVLSLCRHEAFPLSLLESLASGCIVAGFSGIGGREMTDATNGFWAGEDDCTDCATQLAHAMRLVTQGGPAFEQMFHQACATAARFGRDRFEQELLHAWRAMGFNPQPPNTTGR